MNDTIDDRTLYPGNRQAERQQWIDALDELLANGVIDGDDQNALIRHYDEHRQSIESELANLAPEYERRVQSEGQAIADEWLAETARAIGQRDGEGARRLVDQLNVVRNAAQRDASSA